MYTGMKLALAVAPLLLAARAIDVPMACKAMCSPIDDLDRRCDARDGPNEKAEETKCICADTTVVRTIFPLCLDCLRQNPAQRQGDDDDAEDIMEAQAFMSRCGPVGTAQYSPAATSVVQSIRASGGAAQVTGSGGGSGSGSGSGGTGGAAPTSIDTSSATTGAQSSGASGGISAANALYVAGACVVGGLWALT